MAFVRAVVVLALVGSSWQTSPPAVPADAAKTLAAAEALWQSKKPASYEMTVNVMCFCRLAKTPPTFRVVDDKPRTAADLLETTETYARYNTVPKLFYEIRKFLEQKPVKLDVKYDPVYGVPLSIDLDMRSDMADDELKVTITDFKPVNVPLRP